MSILRHANLECGCQVSSNGTSFIIEYCEVHNTFEWTEMGDATRIAPSTSVAHNDDEATLTADELTVDDLINIKIGLQFQVKRLEELVAITADHPVMNKDEQQRLLKRERKLLNGFQQALSKIQIMMRKA